MVIAYESGFVDPRREAPEPTSATAQGVHERDEADAEHGDQPDDAGGPETHRRGQWGRPSAQIGQAPFALRIVLTTPSTTASTPSTIPATAIPRRPS